MFSFEVEDQALFACMKMHSIGESLPVKAAYISAFSVLPLSKGIQPPPPLPEAYDRGLSDHTGDSTIILTSQMVEI